MSGSYVRMICIFNGIPLWEVSYPPQTDDRLLLSGFLSALDTFVTQVTDSTINNLSTSDSDWSFSKVHGNEKILLVLQYPATNRVSLKRELQQLAQFFLTTIRHQFEEKYTSKLLENFAGDITIFDNFVLEVINPLKLFYDIFNRYDSRDAPWLASFKDAEKLFTAALLSVPIFLLVNSIDQFMQDPTSIKFLATIDGLFYGIFAQYERYDPKNSNGSNFPALNTIYFVTKESLSQIPTNVCMINLQDKAIQRGPPPLPLAERMVYELRNVSREKIESVIDHLRSVKENVSHITKLSNEGNVRIEDLHSSLRELDVDLRDAVIVSLEQQIPALRPIIEKLCSQENWDIARFVIPKNGAEPKKGFTVICPRCKKIIKLQGPIEFPTNEKILEVKITSKIPGFCGHEFIAYVNEKFEVQGYSQIKNLDVNHDLRDVFSKL